MIIMLFQYFLIAVFLQIGNSDATSRRHPNVLLIIVDDLRPALGCYGDTYALTPNIDSLAKHGIIFTKAYAQQALCGPSRTSFLTSRRPDTTRLYDVHSYWRTHAGNFTTLPQYFKNHGYHTVAAGKVFHPGIVSNHSDDQPYSWSEDPYHPPTQAHKEAPVCRGSDGNLHANIYCPVEVDEQPDKNLPDIETTAFAVQWLANRSLVRKSSSQPFFMAVGFHKPHIPLKFPVEFLDFYPVHTVPMPHNGNLPEGLPSVAWNPWNDLRRRDDIKELNVSFPFGPIPRYYARYIRQGYYAATTYVDSLIGKLISAVKQHFPDTTVALIGDHGWSLGEHQEWSKYSNFEVSTRVPFIISHLTADKNQKFFKFKDEISFNFSKTAFEKKHNYNKIDFIDERDNLSLYTWESDDYKEYARYRINISTGSKISYKFSNYDGLVELLDLFPTLVDLAGLPSIPACPEFSKNIEICTEGSSLAPVMNDSIGNYLQNSSFINKNMFRVKKAAFSQYPRPGLEPSVKPDSDQPRTSETQVMGYSLRTNRFRYTAWMKFSNITYKPDLSHIYAEELYDHKFDPDEDHNACHKRSYRSVKKSLFKHLFHRVR